MKNTEFYKENTEFYKENTEFYKGNTEFYKGNTEFYKENLLFNLFKRLHDKLSNTFYKIYNITFTLRRFNIKNIP